ncbi:hypothetical protein [Vibrio mediterranei]|nr:hypothetical protein [Vibrio mediterranei]
MSLKSDEKSEATQAKLYIKPYRKLGMKALDGERERSLRLKR